MAAIAVRHLTAETVSKLARPLGNKEDLVHKLFGNPINVEKLVSAPTYADVINSSILCRQGVPEVVFTGRANVGKSSLINSVLGRNTAARISKTAGHTKMLNFFGVGSIGCKLGTRRLVLVDSPGYGSRGQISWGETFTDYSMKRKNLKRIYVCINAEHGVNNFDLNLLRQLEDICLESSTRRGQPLTFQTVLTKCDRVPLGGLDDTIANISDTVFRSTPTCLPPAALTSQRVTVAPGKKMGVGDLRASIAEACGLI